MKKTKKVIATALSATMLLAPTTLRANADILVIDDDTSITVQSDTGLILVGEDPNAELGIIAGTGGLSERKLLARFLAFSGTIKEINYVENEENKADGFDKYVLVECEEGSQTVFRVTDNTYLVTDAEIEVGAQMTGFYDALGIAPLIYPPQYTADVVAVGLPALSNVFVGGFRAMESEDERLANSFTSSDDSLIIHIADSTEIVLQNGDEFDGEISELGNKNLVVIYSIATMSIPPQTTPTKVVVLDILDKEYSSLPSFTIEALTEEYVASLEIVVDDKVIDANAYLNDKTGAIMVPLRIIAETLGYTVEWDEEIQGVMLNGGIMSLSIGKDSYVFGRLPVIELGTAPELKDGTTYVPLNFFTDVARLNNAYVFESQIVINDNERME